MIVFAKSAESNYQFKEKEEKEEERVIRSIVSFGISKEQIVRREE